MYVKFYTRTRFDVEELLVDNIYYFDKSPKRKCELLDYCNFYDTMYRKVLKHIHTRWLSLESAVDRTFRVYPSIHSYLLTEGA